MDCAEAIAKKCGIEIRRIDLSSVRQLLGGSSQTDRTVDVPIGHYAEETMKKTVVPNRNMMMLSIAGAWAVSLKFDAVMYGAHAGDHTIYPDCRKEFIEPLSNAFLNCDWHSIDLYAPFLDLTKGQIAKIGKDLNVPFNETWTCYVGGDTPCGKCGACTERAEAMAEAGIHE